MQNGISLHTLVEHSSDGGKGLLPTQALEKFFTQLVGEVDSCCLLQGDALFVKRGFQSRSEFTGDRPLL